MNFKKLSFLLMFSGVLLITLSVMWFLLAYAETISFIAEYGGSDIGVNLVTCLYSSSVTCEGASYLSDTPSYNPALFWLGGIALFVGVIMHFSLMKNVVTSTAIGLSAADGKILGFIPEKKYSRTVYILMLMGATGGLLVLPLMVIGLVGFILGLLGLFVFRPRLNDLDGNHLVAICVVFTVTFVLLLLSMGSFFFLLVGLTQIALFYIGFNSYRQGRTVVISKLGDEARLALKAITQRFSSRGSG